MESAVDGRGWGGEGGEVIDGGGEKRVIGVFLLRRMFSVRSFFYLCGLCSLLAAAWSMVRGYRKPVFSFHTGTFYDLLDDITSQWLLFFSLSDPEGEVLGAAAGLGHRPRRQRFNRFEERERE